MGNSALQPRKGRRIMIVEDEGDILFTFKDYMRSKGFIVTDSAPTADEALEAFEASLPDIVVMDYRLPGKLNGLQAAEQILGKHPYAKILIVTGHEQAREELASNEFFEDKKIGILVKPVQLSKIARLIDTLDQAPVAVLEERGSKAAE